LCPFVVKKEEGAEKSTELHRREGRKEFVKVKTNEYFASDFKLKN